MQNQDQTQEIEGQKDVFLSNEELINYLSIR